MHTAHSNVPEEVWHKGVMLMAMFARVLRFGFFGLGNPGSGVWLFIPSMIVYGIAFDFFNVSGSLYVDKQTSPEIRSSARGLFMIMTNGIGASVDTFCAQGVVNHFVFSHADPVEQLEGWRISWFCFSGFALAVAILFMLIFRDDHKRPDVSGRRAETYGGEDAGGMALNHGEV